MNCENELLKRDFAENIKSKNGRVKALNQESLARTYSVSLFFDEKSTAELEALILQVAQITKNDYVVKNKIPPHITIGMFKATKSQERQLVEFIHKINFEYSSILQKKENAISFEKIDTLKNKIAFLSLVATKSNSTGKNEIKSLIEQESIIFEINRTIHNSLLQTFSAACNNLYLPQVFFPHCTIATGLSKTQLSLLMAEQNKNQIIIPKSIQAKKLSLAIRHPYQELF